MLKSFEIRRGTAFLSAALLSITICSISSFSTPDFKALEAQGLTFAKGAVQKIGQQWDLQAASQESDPSMIKAGDPSALFKVLAAKLGPIKKIGNLHREELSEVSGMAVNKPDYAAIYKSTVDCELGPATVTVGVIHKDNQWFLSALNVDSKLLASLDQDAQAESKKYAEQMVPSMCSNLDVAFLKQHADPVLAAQLDDKTKAKETNGMFSVITKGLGQFKECGPLSFKGFSLVQGQYSYGYSAEATFQHGSATISIVIAQYESQWKIRSFTMERHPAQ